MPLKLVLTNKAISYIELLIISYKNMKKISDQLIEFIDKEKDEVNRHKYFTLVFKIQNNHLVKVIKNSSLYVRKLKKKNIR